MSCCARRSGSLTRRHGAILRSGRGMLLDETTLCATCWMHGVFAAQLTIGNTSFHKLFSVSRDPYNITRASGLRILVDAGGGWRLLAVPSAFEMGLERLPLDLPARRPHRHRARHRLGRRPGDAVADQRRRARPAASWSSATSSSASASSTMPAGSRSTRRGKRFAFRPDPGWLWGNGYPEAVYHLVTGTPDAIEAIGGDELLYADGRAGRRRLRRAPDPPDDRRSPSPWSAR